MLGFILCVLLGYVVFDVDYLFVGICCFGLLFWFISVCLLCGFAYVCFVLGLNFDID